ncbi:MAG: sensor domain-containing diguanylate cyclase [Kiloniellales bacterium]
MARLPATKASKEDYTRAARQAVDLGLLTPGGPFEHYPGAVLVAGRNGLVLGANPAAEPIAKLLKRGAPAELRDAIDSAVAGRPAQINPLLLPAEGAGGSPGSAFDLAVLPWGDGTAALLLGRDITLERTLRSALIESRQRYKDLVEASSDFAWETDAEGRFSFVSSQGALGYAAAQLVNAPAPELVIDHPEGQDTPFTTRVPLQEVEVWVRRADGEPACLILTALPLIGLDGEWCGARGLCRNITDERRHEARLASDRHRERLLGYILGIVRDEMDPAYMLSAAAGALVPALPASGACIYRRGAKGEFLCAAQAGELPPERLVDDALGSIAGSGDGGGIELVDQAGALFAEATRFDGTCNGAVILWRVGATGPWNEEDRFLLSEIAGQVGLANRQLERQEELEELSSTDPLTGLLNRRSFMEALAERYAVTGGRRAGGALFYIDLDNFKLVNDRHGHQQGDLVLVTLSRILREHTRGHDLAARLGGDEFALFIEGITATSAEQKAREILRAGVELAAYSSGADAPLGLSVGVAVYDPQQREEVQDLVDRADRAMYRVKRRGKGGLEIAAPDNGAGS